jgi:Calx-beta domain
MFSVDTAPVRAPLLLLLGIVTAAAVLAGGASGSAVKPTIGRAVATPAQPQAGSSFHVAFHVANGRSAAFGVTLAGKAEHHVDSFRGGVARTTIALPASAGGQSLTVKVTAHSRTATATKQTTYVVRAVPAPALSIESASTAEGNSGTTPLSFQVTLSHASPTAVAVQYATGDGTATAPSDYAAANGSLTFVPGETSKTIVVSVVGDTDVEQDESFSITLSNPVHATIAVGSATGTITNDDTEAPVAAGYWQGATNEGEYVYFTIGGDRSITDFRANNISENCGDGSELQSPTSWGSTLFPVATDGTFGAQYDWTGSQAYGDITLTAESWKITGIFSAATTMHGTIYLTDSITYQGTNYVCTANLTYTATKVG